MVELDVGRPVFGPVRREPYFPYEIHPGVFSADECERIVQAGLEAGVVEATLEGFDGEDVSDHAIRRSSMSWIEPDADSEWIYERVAGVAEVANQRYGFELTGFYEDMQFTVYDRSGSFYSWHQDGLDGDLENRKLSVVVQLSDPADYDGAELQLFEVAEDYSGEQLAEFTVGSSALGAATVFPSFEYHRVLPLRGGTRYSLVCWVSGPRFR